MPPRRGSPRGSTRASRRIRLLVLRRDGWRCMVRLPGVCTARATEAHHLDGWQPGGDNPARMVASCRPCNQRIGDPRRHDPQPRPRTRW